MNGEEVVVNLKEMAEKIAKFRADLERYLRSPEEDPRCIRIEQRLKEQILKVVEEQFEAKK